MGNKVELLDENGQRINPASIAEYVTLGNSNVSVQDIIDDLEDASKVTTFDEQGNITTTMANGTKHNVVFLSDGSVSETVIDASSKTILTRQTTFAEDGTITTNVVYGE